MQENQIDFKKLPYSNREIEIEIVKYAGEGVTIGYENEKVIFVRYAVPGERVKANVYRETKDYGIADVIEILRPSKERIIHQCPHFMLCGGCDYQMLEYETQLALKEQLAREVFAGIAKIELPELEIVASPEQYYYRNTETFKVNPRKKLIGFFRRDSKFIIDLKECKIAMPKINQALQDIREFEDFPPHNFKVRTTLEGDTTLHWVKSQYKDKDVFETIEAAGKKLQFKISKDSFFQVNDYVIPLWLDKIVSFLDEQHNERIFDLYSGIGLITLFVAGYARETVGVEIAKSSVEDANNNLELNRKNGLENSNVRFIQGDVVDELPKLGYADVMIIDPPRKGIERRVLDKMMEMLPNKIIYSSCKPATLARDIALFSENYRLERVVLVDMFPQTHHMEMIALLIKK